MEKSYLLCPYLKGSVDGALCNVVRDFIKKMDDVDIRMCMGRHFESCYFYHMKIRSAIAAHSCGPALELN